MSFHLRKHLPKLGCVLLAVAVIAVIFLVPFTRSLMPFPVAGFTQGWGVLIQGYGPHELPCYSKPEPPKDDDPLIPSESQRKTTLTPLESFVAQTAGDVFGKEFVYAQAGEARSLLPRGRFEPSDQWFEVWIENDRGWRIGKQQEHWNPKISEVSRKVFQTQPALDGLEFRMYYGGLLTYWIRTSREDLTARDDLEFGWNQVRYSECRKSF